MENKGHYCFWTRLQSHDKTTMVHTLHDWAPTLLSGACLVTVLCGKAFLSKSLAHVILLVKSGGH
jgi:hypothetical protein